MREIKFRAWNGRNFIEWSDLAFLSGEERIASVFEDPTMTYVQYTGLKDKNGKEIYEGDVLLFEGQRCVVKYQGWCFYAHGLEPDYNQRVKNSFDTITADVIVSNQIEVIGNIYENPELSVKES